MKVIGLDISTNTGWAVIEDDKLIDRGFIVLNSKMDLSQRLKYFSIELTRLFEKNKVDWVFIEDVFLGISGAKTLAYLARLNGAAMVVSFNFVKDNIKLYQPTYWKKNSLPGLDGSAQKWEVQLAATKYFNFQLESSFLHTFTARQQEYYDNIKTYKTNLDLMKKLVIQYTNELNRKRNPLSDIEKEKVKDLLYKTKLEVIAIKNRTDSEEKNLNKFMDKICIDISSQTGLTSDIGDAIGIAICGLKEITKC